MSAAYGELSSVPRWGFASYALPNDEPKLLLCIVGLLGSSLLVIVTLTASQILPNGTGKGVQGSFTRGVGERSLV